MALIGIGRDFLNSGKVVFQVKSLSQALHSHCKASFLAYLLVLITKKMSVTVI